MGILVKFYIEDSKKQLNVVVEDYDNVSQKCNKTMLDVMVPLVTKGDRRVSDIDECTNDDLIVDSAQDNWNSTTDDLERVLGEGLGIEISNIAGNAVSCRVDAKQKEKETIPTTLSTDKPQKQKVDEICVLNSPELSEANVAISKCDLGNNHIQEKIRDECEPMILTLDESEINTAEIMLKIGDPKGQNNSEMVENGTKYVDKHSINTTEELIDKDKPMIVTLDELEINTDSAENIPKTDDPKNENNSEIVNNDTKDVDKLSTSTAGSKSGEPKPPSTERPASTESANNSDCLIREVTELDYFEEVDRWSLGDTSEANENGNDGTKVVDLTEEGNVDPSCANSVALNDDNVIGDQDQGITVVNDLSDDEDEIYSQYSSTRDPRRRRTRSVEAVSLSGEDFEVCQRRAISNPPEDSVIFANDISETRFDDCERRPLVVDLTGDKKIECIDLTNEKKVEASSSLTSSPTVVIRRSMNDVMNEVRNFYAANIDAIAKNKKALVALGENPKKGGIKAPPKLSNCLSRSWCSERRKRSVSEVECSKAKILKTLSNDDHPDGLRVRNQNDRRTPIKPLIRVPSPICGPAGYRVNDDLDQLPPMTTQDDHTMSDPGCFGMYENQIPTVLNFKDYRKSRCVARRSSRNYYKFSYSRRFPRNSNSWRQNFSNRFNHTSPLRRLQCAPKSSQIFRPTPHSGEVWLQ